MPVTDPGVTPDAPLNIELPPSGHSRREEFKRRAEDLTQKAEELANEMQAEGIHPDRMKIDREVAQKFTRTGDVHIDNMQPDYQYCLTYRDPYGKFAGQFVWRNMAEGWERVVGDMPEGREFPGMAVTGERWVADCLLMRIPKSRWEALEKEQARKRMIMQRGADQPSDELLAAADRFGTKVTTGDQLPTQVQRAMRAQRRLNSPGSRRASY
jgi:hypothetical protein